VDLVKRYDKGFIKEWPPEAIKAFEDIREQVGHCPSLYFIDLNTSTFLQTDASDEIEKNSAFLSRWHGEVK
jgi:hypothetical protein